jgi:hypothetical protein
MELPLVDGSMIEKPEVLWRYSILTLYGQNYNCIDTLLAII